MKPGQPVIHPLYGLGVYLRAHKGFRLDSVVMLGEWFPRWVRRAELFAVPAASFLRVEDRAAANLWVRTPPSSPLKYGDDYLPPRPTFTRKYFCRNCQEEMRAADHYCQNCGVFP